MFCDIYALRNLRRLTGQSVTPIRLTNCNSQRINQFPFGQSPALHLFSKSEAFLPIYLTIVDKIWLQF